MKFSEQEIRGLFGAEAAEDEDSARLKEYFFKNSEYEETITDLPLRVLVGHKGIGKSALFKVAIGEELENKRLTVMIKPDDTPEIANTNDFNTQIKEWKEGIKSKIAEKVFEEFGINKQNISGALINKGLNLSERIVDIFKKVKDQISLNPVKQLIFDNFLKENKISIYIDDLDRGWKGQPKDIQRISTLLNAIRDLSQENKGLFFRISLRADVYYLVRTSDESTDKIEGSVIWYKWNNHQILALLVKRVISYSGNYDYTEDMLMSKHQQSLMEMISNIIDQRFYGSGKWEDVPMHTVLMSLTRKRPRDLVKLLTLAAKEARKDASNKITTKHLRQIFEEYSQNRLQDTINEYKSELPEIERLIMGMRPTTKKSTSKESYLFSTDQLEKKIKTIQEQGHFKWASNNLQATTKQLAAFMYKINFLTARKANSNGEIDRKYFEENRYISNEFRDFGYDWEIHPAYRWALQPDNIQNVLNSLD